MESQGKNVRTIFRWNTEAGYKNEGRIRMVVDHVDNIRINTGNQAVRMGAGSNRLRIMSSDRL